MTPRFPPIPPSELNAEQKELHDKLSGGASTTFANKGFIYERKDGAMVGPFAPFMYTPPEIAMSFYTLVTSLAKLPGLSPAARETAIITTGVLYKCKYEVYAHENIAETSGVLSRKQIDSLRAGQPPSFEDGEPEDKEEIITAYDVTVAMVNGRGPLSDELWARAEKAYGKMGAAALVHYVGSYLYTCAILNGFDVPIPSKDE